MQTQVSLTGSVRKIKKIDFNTIFRKFEKIL